MSMILDVLSQRKNDNIIHLSNQEIIGIEIRRKRLELSYTLQGLCFDICSPSYLCKIERNQIQANNYILQEICERVSISSEQQQLLFHSYEVLLESVEAFVKDDIDVLNSFVIKGKGFENYRYRILLFMKYIYDGELYLAKGIYNELVKLLSSMQDIDMLIFSIFSVILEYKEKNYQEALDILNQIHGIPMDKNLSILYSKYLYLSSAMMLKGDTMFYYYEVEEKYKNMGYYTKLEELHYSLGIYALKIKSSYVFDYAINLLNDLEYKNSLQFLRAYLEKDFDTIHQLKDKPLNSFSKYLVQILEQNSSVNEVIMHLSSAQDDYDFSANLLKYLALTVEEEKRSFIQSTLPYYKKVKDAYVIHYFMKELLRFNQIKPHNKETITTIYEHFLNNEKR